MTGEGIGLFRTEFLFMDQERHALQRKSSSRHIKGGCRHERKVGYHRHPWISEATRRFRIHGPGEGRESVSWATRQSVSALDRREDVQAAAEGLWRASAFGNIRIMVPLVTCIEEYRQAKALCRRKSRKELDEKGIAYNKDIQMGIMVETAAASLIADIFAKEADFFTIGTNDLTQFYHVC